MRGGFLDHGGAHEGGESAEPSQKPKFCEKVVKDSFLSEIDFSARRPWWDREYEARLHGGYTVLSRRASV